MKEELLTKPSKIGLFIAHDGLFSLHGRKYRCARHLHVLSLQGVPYPHGQAGSVTAGSPGALSVAAGTGDALAHAQLLMLESTAHAGRPPGVGSASSNPPFIQTPTHLARHRLASCYF